MITHYLPQWLLAKFRTSTLYELDILTADVRSRGLKNSGSGADLWPEDIEREVMGRPDNRSAQIFRKRISGQRRIAINVTERSEFAFWLAMFMPRVPRALLDIENIIAEGKKSPEIAVSVMYEHREPYIDACRKRNPTLFGEMVEVYGKEATEEILLEIFADDIRQGKREFWPDPKQAHYRHLKNGAFNEFATILCNYQWVWLESSHGFVIGDNPLVRWHVPSGRWNFGIRNSGVEITMPLSTSLSLLLRRAHTKYSGDMLFCSADDTRRHNMRQRFAATNYVYAGTVNLLEPLKRPTFPPPVPL